MLGCLFTNGGRTHGSYALSLRVGSKRPWPAASAACKKQGWRRESDVRPHPIVAMGPDRHYPLKPALSCRRVPQLSGLDRAPPRDRLRKRSSMGTSRSLRNARDTCGQQSRMRLAAPSSTMRSLQQKPSFQTLGTRLGPGISRASPVFLCSAKWGRFSAPANFMPSTARKRRSMIAQATATRRRRRH
jgi:hypothetical protein